MLHDFSMTLPLSRNLRNRLLALIPVQQTPSARLVVFSRRADVFLIRGEEDVGVTIAKYFFSKLFYPSMMLFRSPEALHG